ncbi:MAG: ABC transporter substrate binding protein [Thermodesulfobacteriota bacterium]
MAQRKTAGRQGHGLAGASALRALRLLVCALAVLALSAVPARAAEILAVLSARLPPYEQALAEFRTQLSRLPAAGPKAIEPHTYTELVLTEAGPQGLARALRDRRPALVLALGRSALLAAAELPQRPPTPLLHLLAPGVPPEVRARPDVTGVDLDVAPAATLAVLRTILPNLRRVGLVYDPQRTGALVDQARAAAREAGLELTALPVGESREVPSRLGELAGRVDLLWLLPDLTVATPDGTASFVQISQRHRVPVLAFSRPYAERGATLTIAAEPGGMAAQAARLARRLLAGESPRRAVPEAPVLLSVTANRAVAAKLGLELVRPASLHFEWLE